jgi:hypothetical protein
MWHPSNIAPSMVDGQYFWVDIANAKEKKTKGQTMIYKALHRKLNIEQPKPY